MDEEQDITPTPDEPDSSVPDSEEDIAQGHEDALQELTPELDGEGLDTPDQHDEILSEMVPYVDLAEEDASGPVGHSLPDAIDRPSTPATQQPTKQRGRYYVPPKDRTPANRQQRRAEHDRILGPANQPPSGDDFGEKAKAFEEAGGEAAAFDDVSGESGGQEDFAEASVRHSAKQDEMLIEHIRRLDELSRSLEMERL